MLGCVQDHISVQCWGGYKTTLLFSARVCTRPHLCSVLGCVQDHTSVQCWGGYKTTLLFSAGVCTRPHFCSVLGRLQDHISVQCWGGYKTTLLFNAGVCTQSLQQGCRLWLHRSAWCTLLARVAHALCFSLNTVLLSSLLRTGSTAVCFCLCLLQDVAFYSPRFMLFCTSSGVLLVLVTALRKRLSFVHSFIVYLMPLSVTRLCNVQWSDDRILLSESWPLCNYSLWCRGCCSTWSDSDAPHSVGLLWTSDRLVVETSLHVTTHSSHYRQISMSSAGHAPAIPASEQTQTPRLRRRGHWDRRWRWL